MKNLTPGKFSLPVERAAVQRDWGARGYGCGLFVDPPGRQWNDFVHDTHELVTVLEGELELTIERERFRLRPGDEAFIRRGARHSVRNTHRETTRWLYGYDQRTGE